MVRFVVRYRKNPILDGRFGKNSQNTQFCEFFILPPAVESVGSPLNALPLPVPRKPPG